MPRVGRKKHIPNMTRVEVCDEGRWHRGGTIIDYTPETGDYMIQWAAWGNEITTANEVDVRAEVQVKWRPVKHPAPFSITATKSRYPDYIEANRRPVEPTRQQRASEEPARQEGQQWAAPSGKPAEIPSWESQLAPHQKKVPHWEKRLDKFRKRALVSDEGRPAFGVTQKAKIPDWRPQYVPAPQPLSEHQDKRYMKYWGRFAPEHLVDEELEQLESVRSSPKRSTRRSAPRQQHADPVYSEADAHEEEQAEAEAAEAEPEVEEQAEEAEAEAEPEPEPEPEAEVVEEAAATEEAPKEALGWEAMWVACHEEEGDDAPLACDAITAKVPALTEGTEEVKAEAVKVALGIAAPQGEEVDKPAFEVFHTALTSYLSLAGLYQDKVLDDAIDEDPALFERSVPMISSWGIEMLDINNAFADHEVKQTLAWFLAWAVNKRCGKAEEAPKEVEKEAPVEEEEDEEY